MKSRKQEPSPSIESLGTSRSDILNRILSSSQKPTSFVLRDQMAHSLLRCILMVSGVIKTDPTVLKNHYGKH